MNSCVLSLIISSASLVQSQYPNTICAIAECWLVQYRRGEQDIFYPIRVRCWGANADALSSVPKNTGIVVVGGLWVFKEYTMLEASQIILNYQGNFINEVAIAGRQGKDLSQEIIKTTSNKDTTIMQSIAIDFNQETTTWINVKAWNNQANVLARFGRKGEHLGVQGSINVNQWIDTQTGEQKQMLIVNVNRIHLMSSKPKELAVA